MNTLHDDVAALIVIASILASQINHTVTERLVLGSRGLPRIVPGISYYATQGPACFIDAVNLKNALGQNAAQSL